MNAAAPPLTPARIVARVAAATVGGWAFCWGFASLGITALVALGVDFHDAHTALMLLVFLVWLALFCWTFAARRTLRVWAVLAGGAAAMTAAAWGLQSVLL